MARAKARRPQLARLIEELPGDSLQPASQAASRSMRLISNRRDILIQLGSSMRQPLLMQCFPRSQVLPGARACMPHAPLMCPQTLTQAGSLHQASLGMQGTCEEIKGRLEEGDAHE